LIGKEVLVVDDEEDTLNLVKVILESEGYRVEIASRGLKALEEVRKRKPDLILLDIRLPDILGYEVCRRLKGNIETEAIPIVMFSASLSGDTRSTALEAGADDFLLKPFALEQILEAVKRNLEV